jgi:hypothetical protein
MKRSTLSRERAGELVAQAVEPLLEVPAVMREAGIVDAERRGLWDLLPRDPRRPRGADRMAELTDDQRSQIEALGVSLGGA